MHPQYIPHDIPHDIQTPADIKLDKIEFVPYQSAWPQLAQIEVAALKQILPITEIVDIQHIGSTAIPHMIAKPIIDIQIAVKNLALFKSVAIEQLAKLDYVFWFDNPDDTRLFFVKGMPPFGEKRTHHVHIFERTSPHWQNRLFFRDYLIHHPNDAKMYATLKRQLAEAFTEDREQYTAAKSTFIQNILAKKCI